MENGSVSIRPLKEEPALATNTATDKQATEALAAFNALKYKSGAAAPSAAMDAFLVRPAREVNT